MMRFREINEEVLYVEDSIIKVDSEDIEYLKKRANQNQRKRIRLCAHKDVDDKLHEMLIVHGKDAYIRPHKHLTKCESFHVIEGSADVIIFDDAGDVTEIIHMGNYYRGDRFYYRLSEPCYHTLLIRSEFLVFREAANGPFRREDTLVAPWAPDENDGAARDKFMNQLSRTAENFLSSRHDEMA